MSKTNAHSLTTLTVEASDLTVNVYKSQLTRYYKTPALLFIV